MSLPDYDSPSALKAILDSRSMAMQKKFGQNFLINANARTKLAESLDLQEGMKVWEVGPGYFRSCNSIEIMPLSKGL